VALYNLASVANEIHRYLGYLPKFTTAILYEAANKAQEEVLKSTRHITGFWRVDTMTGDDGKFLMEYVFSMNVLEVLGATVDGVPMKGPISIDEWDNTEAEESIRTGRPYRYMILNGDGDTKSISVFPRPDKVYTIQCPCVLVPTEMTSATDVPAVPRHSKHSMVLWGAHWCAASDLDPQMELRAKFLLDLYERQLAKDKAALKVNEVIKTKRRR
jgi:hypothetical protein